MGHCPRALRLAVITLMAAAAPRGTLSAQGQAGAAAADSGSSLSGLSVRLLVLKVQVQTLRARIGEQASSALAQGSDGSVWADSVAALRTGLTAFRSDVHRLRRAYERVRHADGLRFTRELDAMTTPVEQAVAALAAARDTRAARIEITHISARLDALLERISAADTCCRITPG